MSNTIQFKRPPVVISADDRPRTVGFELEFTGLDLEQATDALSASLGAQVLEDSAAERVLGVESLGKFRIELDWDYLKRKAAENQQHETDSDWVDLLSQAALLLVPIEVVCPPIPVTGLEVLDPMVQALRDAGAVGTEDSPVAAYGVHVNTEIPRVDAETISRYLKAFALLQWWLVQSHDVDLTRRITPFIDLYPEAYVERLLSRPECTMDQIFDDYLAHNATRNRALDLLTLLAEIDGDRVRRAVDDPRIKARPAFHYRLPNCHIEKPDWSLASAWNRWCVVEQLAHRKEDLDTLGALFLERSRPLLGVSRDGWVEHMDQWLKDRGLA